MSLKILLMIIVIAVSLAGLLLTLRWINAAPSPVSPTSLAFPCLQVIDDSIWKRKDRPEDLTEMNSDFYMNRRQDPIIIDSSFQAYEMTELKMRGTELSLLITGPRMIEVDFVLIPRPDLSGEQAKALAMELCGKRPLLEGGWQKLLPKSPSMDDYLKFLERPRPRIEPE